MIYHIRITIWMLHTITKRLEIYIDINISKADHLRIFTSKIFRIAWKKVSGVGVAYLGPRGYHDINRVRTIFYYEGPNYHKKLPKNYQLHASTFLWTVEQLLSQRGERSISLNQWLLSTRVPVTLQLRVWQLGIKARFFFIKL